MLNISKDLLNNIIEHVRQELPNEGCGLLAGKDGKVAKVYQMTNTDKSPVTFFMDPGEQFVAMKDMRQLDLDMVGIYHSHVAAPAYPSPRDVRLAYYPDVFHVIVSLAPGESQEVRAFKIRDGTIYEEKIVVGE